jgi:hypothetical protein
MAIEIRKYVSSLKRGAFTVAVSGVLLAATLAHAQVEALDLNPLEPAGVSIVCSPRRLRERDLRPPRRILPLPRAAPRLCQKTAANSVRFLVAEIGM